jgi:hypothetical protein
LPRRWCRPSMKSATRPPRRFSCRRFDLLGHAPTGTGKTAAFALPLLARLDLRKRRAGHGADARPASWHPGRRGLPALRIELKGFHVLPIYGGQDYGGQLRQLKRGVHVVVGTPGASWTTCAAAPSGRRCRPWCWTRPTRCCAWASSTTSSGSSSRRRRPPDGAVLGDHARAIQRIARRT